MIKRSILLGRGAQPWIHIPRDALGRPTRVASATYTIVDATRPASDPDRVVATDTVGVDAVSTTLTAAAGANTAYPSQLSPASGAGFIEGHTYLLTAGDGSDREAVVCKSVGASSLTAALPVRGIYPAMSALRGIELTATFPEAWADDEDRLLEQGREFEIVWSYEIEGRPVLAVEPIPVNRWSMTPWIDEDYVLTGRRALRDRLQPDDIHGALVAATRKVVAELETANFPAESYRTTEAGRLAVAEYALHLLYSNLSGDEDRAMSDAHRSAYKSQIHQLLQGQNHGVRVVDQATGKTRPVYADLNLFRQP